MNTGSVHQMHTHKPTAGPDGYSLTEVPSGMSRDEAVDRLVRMRERRRRQASDGYVVDKIRDVVRDRRMDLSYFAGTAAATNASAALDYEALSLAIVALLGTDGGL